LSGTRRLLPEAVSGAVSGFEDFLRRRGFRVTRTRLRIAERALQYPGHFRAVDLWGALRGHRISITTIYRTLDLLEQAGLVGRCVLAGTSGAVYESYLGRGRHHGHLVCRRCGRVVEFKSRDTEMELERVAGSHGFRLEEAAIQGVGLCRVCRADR